MKKNILLVILFVISFNQPLFAQGFDKPIYQIETHRGGVLLGTFDIELFPLIAPLHTQNFDSLVMANAFDSTAFHRVVPNFVIQGGDPNSINGPVSTWGYGNPNQPTVNAEFSPVRHYRGRLGAARDADTNSANSQFYICVANAFNLDGAYTVYGQVTSGMEIVDSIVLSPTVPGTERPVQKIEMFITAIGVNDTVPDPPALIAPTDGAAGIAPITNFQWTNINSAVMYTIELSTDSLFSTIAIWKNAGINSTTIPTLIGSTQYYWRVKSNNGGHESAYSNIYSFTSATAAPLLIAPHDTATNVYLNPVFQWSSVPGSTSYTLQVSTSSVFTGTNLIYNQSGLVDTVQQVPGLNPNTNYWWRTRSASGTVQGLYSVKYSFTTGTTLLALADHSNLFLSKIYPNPAHSSLNIELSIRNSGLVDISLNDNNGKKVYNHSIHAQQSNLKTTIDVSQLPKGIYLISIKMNGEEVVRKVNVN